MWPLKMCQVLPYLKYVKDGLSINELVKKKIACQLL